MRKTKKEKKN